MATTTTSTTSRLEELEQQNTPMCSVEKDSFGSPIDAGDCDKLKRTKKGRNEVRFSTEQPVISSETRETIVSADDVKLTNNTSTKRAMASSSTRPPTAAGQQTTSSSTPCDITSTSASSWTTDDGGRSQTSVSSRLLQYVEGSYDEFTYSTACDITTHRRQRLALDWSSVQGRTRSRAAF